MIHQPYPHLAQLKKQKKRNLLRTRKRKKRRERPVHHMILKVMLLIVVTLVHNLNRKKKNKRSLARRKRQRKVLSSMKFPKLLVRLVVWMLLQLQMLVLLTTKHQLQQFSHSNNLHLNRTSLVFYLLLANHSRISLVVLASCLNKPHSPYPNLKLIFLEDWICNNHNNISKHNK